MRFAGWFGIAVGVSMIAMWLVFFTVLGVPELEREPVRLAFHLVAEALTAAALLVGGVALLANRPWARGLSTFATGMLAYISVNGSGYFAQRGEWPFVVMFAVVLSLAAVSLARLYGFRSGASGRGSPARHRGATRRASGWEEA
jgi:hypothetical protein